MHISGGLDIQCWGGQDGYQMCYSQQPDEHWRVGPEYGKKYLDSLGEAIMEGYNEWIRLAGRQEMKLEFCYKVIGSKGKSARVSIDDGMIEPGSDVIKFKNKVLRRKRKAEKRMFHEAILKH